MKTFFELGKRYMKNSDWKDMTLVKFCLCSMGILLGCLVPLSARKTVMLIAGLIFLGTYIPLMYKVYRIWRKMK